MEILKKNDETSYQLSGHGPRNVGVLKQAFGKIDEDIKSDIYGTGAAINDFENKIAEFLGKEKAVFFPIWKKRHGGDLISLYPYIFTADYYFDKRKDKMTEYYESAKELARRYNSCAGITKLPEIPVSNMVHVHIHKLKETAAHLLGEVQQESGIGLSGYVREIDAGTCSFEVSLGDSYPAVPQEDIERASRLLDEKMKT